MDPRRTPLGIVIGMAPIRRDPLERLLDRCSGTDDSTACWTFRGGLRSGGYSQVAVGGQNVLGHRLTYERLVGPIPEGLTIDHLCRNRACVNPAHLEPVTMGVNTERGISPSAVNAAKDSCLNGHPFNEANTYRRKDKPGRECRACRAERTRSWAERQAG